ncbi:MAG: YjbQ family protein [Candidatus Blackburnbacteria bacterium]|nr:YjbQ family protein [Candidatus Blackburnbacteria bacterium]
MVSTSTITVTSSNEVPELINITDKIKKNVQESGIKNGLIVVFSQHTTAAVLLQENEAGIHKDLKEFLESISSRKKDYHHSVAPDHLVDQMPNGHSHLWHFLVGGSSQSIPIVNGELLLGQYQSLFLVELDHARTRNVVVQIIGEF